MSDEKQSWGRRLRPKITKDSGLSLLRDFIDGRILVRIKRFFPIIICFFIFCLIYITNRYVCERAERRQRELVLEIEDLQFELLSVSAELTKKSRRTVIEDSVRVKIPDLEIAKVPSFIIE